MEHNFLVSSWNKLGVEEQTCLFLIVPMVVVVAFSAATGTLFEDSNTVNVEPSPTVFLSAEP